MAKGYVIIGWSFFIHKVSLIFKTVFGKAKKVYAYDITSTVSIYAWNFRIIYDMTIEI